MSRIDPTILQSLLERAATEEIGLLVETNNPEALNRELSVHRHSIQDLRFADLIISIPSIKEHICIHHRTPRLET